jgi:hypothetical protein
VLAFSSFSPKLKTLIRSKVRTASEVIFRTNMQRIKTDREKEERHKAIILVPSTNRK